MSDIKEPKAENILVDLMSLKDKLEDAKAILKSYKIRSERLTQLKRAKKDLNLQIEEEKKNIEDEFLENEDYEQASNDQLALKNQIKEKNSDLKVAMSNINTSQTLSSYEYNIKGEPIKLQVERVVKVYINGKEEK